MPPLSRTQVSTEIILNPAKSATSPNATLITVSMALDIAPRLPPELELDIFEYTGINYRRERRYKDLAGLCLVARRVHVWIESILYGVAIHAPYSGRSSRWTSPPLHSLISKSDGELDEPTPPPRFSVYTKHILFQDPKPQTILRIFQSCPNLQNVALWTARRGVYEAIHNIIGTFPLRRLSADLGGFMHESSLCAYIERHTTLFGNLTHLSLHRLKTSIFVISSSSTDGDPTLRSDLWEPLSRCPNLTHLSFSFPDPTIIQAALDTLSATLKILVITGPVEKLISSGSPTDFMLSDIVDSRLVLVVLDGYYENLFGDWELGASGGDDIWARGEAVQATGETIEMQLERIHRRGVDYSDEDN